MYSGDGAELVQQQAVHSPLHRDHFPELVVKVFHLALDEAEPAFSVFQHCVFGVAVLFFVLLEDDAVDGLSELAPVVFSQYFYDFGGIGDEFWANVAGLIFVGFEVFDDDFEEFFHDEVFFFVEGLDLGNLFVLFEVLGKLVEGGDEVGDHFVLFVFAGFPEFFYGVDHHDELLEGVDAESQISLGDVQALQIFAHVVYDFF